MLDTFEKGSGIQGIFCPSLGAEFWPHYQMKIATFFPQYHVHFSQIKKSETITSYEKQ